MIKDYRNAPMDKEGLEQARAIVRGHGKSLPTTHDHLEDPFVKYAFISLEAWKALGSRTEMRKILVADVPAGSDTRAPEMFEVELRLSGKSFRGPLKDE